MSDQASAPIALESLVARAEKIGVSDIHLQMAEGKALVSFRLDGVMAPAKEIECELADRVFGRVKYLAKLKTYQESLPQDGRINRDDIGSQNDVRVATYPTVSGEKIVLRLFSDNSLTLDELELEPSIRKELDRLLQQTSGMLLLTGPAGSGKTTTIYACLKRLAELGGRHVITVEDPAEQIIPGIMQTEINDARGLTFAQATRHLLRQDPQVLAIGEIRDEETANIAVRAALTGHLVISTLHAGSCRGVFERLLAMCEDRFSVIASTSLVLNQRLLRKICDACSGKGCEQCLRTGHRGRIPAIEKLVVTDTLRQRIRENGAETVTPETSLREATQALLLSGKISAAEFIRVIGDSPMSEK